MKIAYLIDYDLTQTSGVVQKILQQSKQWLELGNSVYFISSKTLTIYDENRNIIVQLNPLNREFGRLSTALKLLYSSYFLGKLLEKIEFDVLYMRYRLYMPFVAKELKKYKVVMEINSDDTLEYKLHSKLTHWYNKLTRAYILSSVDGFVCVSEELTKRFTYLNKPIETIANGIDTSEYSFYQHTNQVPTFVFIGTPNQTWHGLDKIIKMAEYFTEYQFYIIGTSGENTDNIKYFGYLGKAEATQLIQRSDIGIGTLSLYKKGLTEASPLKTRQYLACGVPIIYAYKDTDLRGDEVFALELNNSEDNIDYAKIKEFVCKVFSNTLVKEQARKFAQNTLDYSLKEKRRINFFQRIIDGE